MSGEKHDEVAAVILKEVHLGEIGALLSHAGGQATAMGSGCGSGCGGGAGCIAPTAAIPNLSNADIQASFRDAAGLKAAIRNLANKELATF